MYALAAPALIVNHLAIDLRISQTPEVPSTMIIGDRLRLLREQKKFSQGDASSLINQFPRALAVKAEEALQGLRESVVVVGRRQYPTSGGRFLLIHCTTDGRRHW